jgi:hypothetical protein
MKHLVLIFLLMAAVCVVSASPAAAQDTITGAPRGTAPVTVEGYANTSGSTGAFVSAIGSASSGLTSAIGSALSVPASATSAPEQCHVIRDFNDAHARDTDVCGP